MASEGGEQNTRFAKNSISIGLKSTERDRDRDRGRRWGGEDMVMETLNGRRHTA